jgi:excisionase family DNA binding protein
MESERLLTVEQLAGWLQVKPRTIYQWVHEEYIPVVKLGTCVRFRQGSVAEWIAKCEQPGRRRRALSVDID